jgi:glutamine cyclotransferase
MPKKLKVYFKLLDMRFTQFVSGLVLFTAVAFISCDNDTKPTYEKPQPVVRFEQPFNNAKVQRGKSFTVVVQLNDFKEITQLVLYTKDSIFFSGQPTTNELKIELYTQTWKVGTNQLTVEATLAGGKTTKDNRIIKVLSDVYPEDYTVKVITAHPHLTTSYTQGLEFDNGTLYEGTGGMGSTGISLVGKVDYKTGEIKQKFTLDASYFGEGITILGDDLYQLTWQQNKCFVYDKNTLQRKNDFTYNGEGWGLCNDGNVLIMSDGSERLYFRDPVTFGLLKTIEVYSNQGPVKFLNELEYIEGKIYANLYQSNNIVIINPTNGIVEGIIDCSELALEYRKSGEVLNGIAYKKDTQRLFLTGKNWPNLLEVELVKL